MASEATTVVYLAIYWTPDEFGLNKRLMGIFSSEENAREALESYAQHKITWNGWPDGSESSGYFEGNGVDHCFEIRPCELDKQPQRTRIP